MAFILLYFAQLLVFFLVFNFFDTNYSEEIAVVFIIFNTIMIIYWLNFKTRLFTSVYLFEIILTGFFLRILLLFLDVYKIIPILHSGRDSESFHMVAAANVIRSNINLEWDVYTNYSNLVSGIYMLCNTQRLVGQYLNVLLGMGMIYYIWLSCRELNISNKTIKIVITIICCFPTAIIFSSILLREAWQEFFLTYSLFYFIKWFKSAKKKYMLVSISAVLGAAYMHSGSLCVVMGYLFAYIFYDPKKDLVQKSITNISKLFVVGILFLLFFFSGTTFTERFNPIEQMEKEVLLESFEARSDAGSLYLGWINFNSTWEVILFSPLKMFYFMFSPIPFDWRGLNDFIAFFINSMFYVFFLYKIIKYRHLLNGRIKSFLNFILISLFVTIFIFSYGTQTAGTAMRHRCKIISLVLISFAIVYDEKEKCYLYNPNYLN